MAIEILTYYDEYKLYAKTPHYQSQRDLHPGPGGAASVVRVAVVHALCAAHQYSSVCDIFCTTGCCADQHPFAFSLCDRFALHLLAPLPGHDAAFAAPGRATVAVDCV